MTFDRKRSATINIFLSLDMVIERISLSFVGSIATHHSHTSSTIEPIFISVSSSTINSFILLFLVEDCFVA
jgi:hypothetical protein